MRNNFLSKTLKMFIFSSVKDRNTRQLRQKARNIAFEKMKSDVKVGTINLKNRFVLVTKNRCRAIENVPNRLMQEYYKQRSGAGLIITENTAVSPSGMGYARMPGIYNKRQISGWENVTTAVHNEGAKIFIQLLHTGRISHHLNMPEGTEIIAPSGLRAEGQIWTDMKRMQDFPIPKEMNTQDLWQTKTEFVTAARNAILAGFDGVELNAANGYLLEQFISPLSNIRKDHYSGNIENRCRFVLEIVNAVAVAIGKNKIGVRLSPYGLTNDMQHYYGIGATYKYLAEQLNLIGIAYLHLVNFSEAKTQSKNKDHLKNKGHIVDYSVTNENGAPIDINVLIRSVFKNTIVLSGDYSFEKAELDIQSGLGDLVAFGGPFINNPDLVDRYKNNWPLSNDLKMDLIYSDDEKGYTDYPNYNKDNNNSIYVLMEAGKG